MNRDRTPSTANELNYQTLEPRQLLAGDVSVSLRGSTLWVIGDSADNRIEVAINPNGGLTLTGIDTQLNGQLEPIVLQEPVRHSTFLLGRGDDWLTLSGINIGGRLKIRGGAGNDHVRIEGCVSNQCDVQLGSGNDILQLQSVDTNSFARLRLGAGDDLLAVNTMHAGGKWQASTGGGNDTVALEATDVGRQLQLHLGAGDDQVLFSDSVHQAARTQVRMGSGNDTLAVMTHDTGPMSARWNGGSGQNRVSLPDRAGTLTSSRFEEASMSRLEITDQIFRELKEAGIDATDFGAAGLILDPVSQRVEVTDRSPSISVLWDRVGQQAVVAEKTGPTIASRAYAMLHTAMYDAWSAFDGPAVSTSLGDSLQRPPDENTDARKRQAMSFAAYRVLTDLFPNQGTLFDGLMAELGYATTTRTLDATHPAGIGNRMAEALLETRHADGSNQLGDDARGIPGVPYSDPTGYQPANPPGLAQTVDRWTPEMVPIDADPAGHPAVERFLTPQWGSVQPFALSSGEAFRPATPEPFLLVDAEVDLDSATIRFHNGDIVPVTNDLVGTVINPRFIDQAEQVVAYSAGLTDRQKLIAEFWEDAGGTSFPPGTWMTFGQLVSARHDHSVDDDARLFFALGNAVFDVGIAVWEAKVHYDYVRPVRAIRTLGALGLIGQYDETLGGYAIDAWTATADHQRILATDFMTYQTPGSHASPPFAEYTSGHSGFSAAGAEILRRFTGSDIFNAAVTFQPGQSRFEPGVVPQQAVTLSWNTFQDAADEAGVSRRYGGIHFSQGDLEGRSLGVKVADAVWQKTQLLIQGKI